MDQDPIELGAVQTQDRKMVEEWALILQLLQPVSEEPITL